MRGWRGIKESSLEAVAMDQKKLPTPPPHNHMFFLPSASGTPSAPLVSIHPPQLTVQPGQLAEFRCSATGHPTPTLEWTGEAVAGMTFRAWLSWMWEARTSALGCGEWGSDARPAGADPLLHIRGSWWPATSEGTSPWWHPAPARCGALGPSPVPVLCPQQRRATCGQGRAPCAW